MLKWRPNGKKNKVKVPADEVFRRLSPRISSFDPGPWAHVPGDAFSGGYGGFSGPGYGPFTFLGLGTWLLVFWDLGK